MAVKHYKVTKNINGVDYTAQFAGVSVALRATDECKGTDGELSNMKSAQYILSNVIVSPANLDIDDFADTEELGEVTSFGSGVMSGKIKPEDTEETEETEKQPKKSK